ncbi:MAG: two-component system, chemotaxis family, CheB/CheR fusion protein [Abditibacteriota bacterium]|nr:two-component system, chemotaxis family, CheB/CheR fusion protein [Abditibacteriota bacterium]
MTLCRNEAIRARRLEHGVPCPYSQNHHEIRASVNTKALIMTNLPHPNGAPGDELSGNEAASMESSDREAPGGGAPQSGYGELGPSPDSHILPVVGLGGSAGSIAALQTFFSRLPADTGLAYVVVVHLAPQHESHLAEVLQPHTGMTVVQVNERVQIAADHVYIIPPRKHLEIVDGHLELSEPEHPRGKRVAVDLFLRTLAETHGHHAVGVILSGADGDGSIGIKRIKEYGGVTIAQDPDDAEHDSMPRNAIETGMIDWILPVEKMPAKLLEFRLNEDRIVLPSTKAPPRNDEEGLHHEAALREVLSFLHARTGHDFSCYKRATVLRRIARRLQVNSLQNIPDYVAFLRTHPGEAGALLQDLLISVTNFFRDGGAFHMLEEMLPQLFHNKKAGDTVRVWVAGCATGEEAYSIGMLLIEHSDRLQSPPSIQIFATDIDEQALLTAREGLYPAIIATDVSAKRLRRFFVQEQTCYRVRKELREKILFASHNLLNASPFSRLDLVSCRNLLIYFNREAQEKVFTIFHFALQPDGLLFLGAAEAGEEANTLFVALDKKHRLFARLSVSRQPLPLPTTRAAMASPSPHLMIAPRLPEVPEVPELPNSRPLRPLAEPSPLSFGELHFQLLERFAPPSLLVNENYDIVHLSPNVGRFVRFTGGDVSINLLKVVHPDLRLELRTALFRAVQSGKSVDVERVLIEIDGESLPVTLRVQPLHDAGSRQNFILVVFEPAQSTSDVVQRPINDSMAQRLDEEIQYLKTHLRATIEQYDAATEELKASNEELQALNEELSSTTEELETSAEELQSVNEELTTVNHELKLNNEEVSRTNSDLQNLMAATDIATIFLDRELRIVRYTPRAQDLFQLLPADTGRPLSDLRHNLIYSQLAADLEQVRSQSLKIETEVATTVGSWYLMRILPYRTLEERVDGVVLTFVDITQRKGAQEQLRQSQERFRLLVESVDDYAIFVIDESRRITTWNSGVQRVLGYSEKEWIGQLSDIIFTPEDRATNQPEKEKQTALRDGRALDERWHVRQDSTRFFASGVLTTLYDSDGKQLGFAKILRDVTEQKHAEAALRSAHDEMERRVVERTQELLISNKALQNEVVERRRVEATRERLLSELKTERKRLEEVLERMPVGVIIAQAPDGPIVLINEQVRKLFQNRVLEMNCIAEYSGWEATDIKGRPYKVEELPLTRALQKGEMVNGEEMKFPLIDGTMLQLSVSAAPLRDASGEIIAAITTLQDIRDLKQAEQVRQQLLQRLVTAQEEERRRISRELHDQMGQQLTALLMGLTSVSEMEKVATSEEASTRLKNLHSVTTQLMSQMHRLAWELRPATLDNLGLEATLEQFAEEWSQSTEIKVDFICRGLTKGQRLPAHLETTLYRIVQEALTNVQRHAGPSRVSVLIERDKDSIVAIVEDNGHGFAPNERQKLMARDPAANRLGLVGMQERIDLVGGTLTIESIPGAGTTIYARVPMERRKAPRD